ncbi:unnamed protein product, partial [Amoebophrya sp. A25]
MFAPLWSAFFGQGADGNDPEQGSMASDANMQYYESYRHLYDATTRVQLKSIDGYEDVLCSW